MSRAPNNLYHLVVALFVFCTCNIATNAADIAVSVHGRSSPELCAEKDNVEINLVSPVVRRFRIMATHPAYIGMIARDRYAPDYTSCNISPGKEFAAGAQRVTFFETPRFWLTGYRLPEFWRPADVPVRVGTHVERGLHLIQLWMRYRERAEEVLVLYPPDGYWRMRPFPPGDMRWTAYGTSFLIGPVETIERPVVTLEEIEFDADARAFTLRFKRGGSARVALAMIDEDRAALDVTFDTPTIAGLPFASLRSMYTTEDNADAAQIAWRAPDSIGWTESPVMRFRDATASEFWLGRRNASRHNLSAPDIVVKSFSDTAAK